MTPAARVVPESAVTDPPRNTRVVRGGIFFIVCAIGVWLLPRALRGLDYFHVQTVQLEGARFLTPTSVVAALGTDTAASVFDDPARFVAKVESIPLVARARVRRRLPGTLVVTIVERTPVALVATANGFRGETSPSTASKAGVISLIEG